MSVKGLVETQWLADNLDNPDLRLFDCTVFLLPGKSPAQLFEIVSGREQYQQGHIPGAGFIDVIDEVSAPNTEDSRLAFTFPDADTFQSAMSAHGIDNHSHVVLYSSGSPMWATRVWWLLRAYGFDNASVLNGGLTKWQLEGRPLTTETAPSRRGNFTARLREGLVVGKNEVLQAIADPDCTLVDSLTGPTYSGNGDQVYGRPGHISGAVNVSVMEDLIDQDTMSFVSLDKARDIYHGSKVTPDSAVICYCGGGIAATGNAFLLTQLGYENVAVYDNSMLEWGWDASLPMEKG